MNRNRFLSLFLAVTFAFSLAATPIGAIPKEGAVTFPVGDVDLSGSVDASDLTALARHVGHIASLADTAILVSPDGTHFPLGDVDLSTEADASDLTALARHVGHIEDLSSVAYGIRKVDEIDAVLTVDGEKGLLSYTFAGDRYDAEGYAAGLVTMPAIGSFTLYWADKSGTPLANYTAIVEKAHEAYSFPKNALIPAEAETLVLRDGATTKDTVKIPSTKRLSETAYFTFGSLSDIHANYEKNAAGKFTNALNWFDTLGLDYVLISGDLSGDGKVVANYETYVAAAKASTFPFANIIEARGNHDSQETANFLKYTATDANGTRDSREVHPYTDSPYFYQLIDGGEGHRDNLVIALTQELSGISNSFNQDNMTTKQLDWFESVLEKFAGTETNIFVLFHPLIYRYGPGDSDDGGYQEALMCIDRFPNNMRLKSILTKYREIITMSGHTHISFEAGYNFDDEDGYAPRMFHNPSCYALKEFFEVGSLTDADSNDTYGSQGYAARVYDSYITYSGANLLDRQFIPAACYIIDTVTEDRSLATSIAITAKPQTDYAIGDNFDPKGMEVTATLKDGSKVKVNGWTYDLYRTLEKTDKKITVSYGDLTATLPISVGGHIDNSFEGNGTKASPYLIRTADDFFRLTQNMRQMTSTSSSTRTDIYGVGLYFKQTADIDMSGYPGYEGIFADANRKYGFGGVYDGDGHTLTVALHSRAYRKFDVCVFPYLNGVIKNLTFAGYLESDIAQPIRTVGSYGVVVNCISHMELRGNKSHGLTQTVYGTIARWYADETVHGTKYALEGTDQGGKYYAVYTNVVNGDGEAATSTHATAVTDAATALAGFTGLDSAAAAKVKAIDPTFDAAELLTPVSDNGTLNFLAMKPRIKNIAPSGTAFDEGKEPYDSTHTVAALNDGDSKTSWQLKHPTDGATKYFGVMFDKAQTIDAVTIEWESGSRATKGGYSIEYTTDGETWQALSNACYRYEVETNGSNVKDEIDVTPVKVLGVRVMVRYLKNSKYAPKVYELCLWQND